jgi:uncharacterized protein YbaP (TraB family)
MLKHVFAALAAFAALVSPAVAQDEITPPFYVVRDADSTMYLFGTVHIRPSGADWGNARVRAALAETQEIWTELEMSPAMDARAQTLAMQLGMAPPGRPLSSWLTPEENQSLNATLTRMGFPAGALEQFQPWLAGLTLSLVPVIRAGYDPNSGVDRAVDAFGDANGKTMRAFETVEEQLGFFADMSPEAQREMLREAIAQEPEAAAIMGHLTQAWERGDIETLNALVIDDARLNYPEMYDVIFVQRNNAWMRTLVSEMNGSGVDFVAVGAGHLLGEHGLVAQMRDRGYTVEAVR